MKLTRVNTLPTTLVTLGMVHKIGKLGVESFYLYSFTLLPHVGGETGIDTNGLKRVHWFPYATKAGDTKRTLTCNVATRGFRTCLHCLGLPSLQNSDTACCLGGAASVYWYFWY
jgi:hypothetical protein